MSRIFNLLFWLTLVTVYVLALLPPSDIPTVPVTDKAQHFAAFLTLGILARLALIRSSSLKIAGSLALFGALIEFSQMIPPISRDASIHDWFADLFGIAIGLMLATMLRSNIKNSA